MLPAHLRSVLTMTWSPDVRFLPMKVAHLQKQRGDRGVKCKLQQATDAKFNPTGTQGLFALSLRFREEFELFAEGFNDQLPLKYRYLSLYKLFEKHFVKVKDQNGVLNPFRKLESDLGLTKSIQIELKDVRDRCAHIALRRNKKGMASLSRRDEKKISDLLPILLSVCSDVISELADHKFSINGEPGWHRYAAVLELTKSQ